LQHWGKFSSVKKIQEDEMKIKILKKMVCVSGMLFIAIPVWSAVPSDLIPLDRTRDQAPVIADFGDHLLEGDLLLAKRGGNRGGGGGGGGNGNGGSSRNGSGSGSGNRSQSRERTRAHIQTQTQLQNQERTQSKTQIKTETQSQ
jgi:hypothetical protein